MCIGEYDSLYILNIYGMDIFVRKDVTVEERQEIPEERLELSNVQSAPFIDKHRAHWGSDQSESNVHTTLYSIATAWDQSGTRGFLIYSVYCILH